MQAAVSQQGSLYRLTLTSLDFDWKWNAHWIAHTIEAPQFVAFRSQRLSRVWSCSVKNLLFIMLDAIPRKEGLGSKVRLWGSSSFSCQAGVAKMRKQFGDLKPKMMWSFPLTARKRGGMRRRAKIEVWGEIVCIRGIHSKVFHSPMSFSFVSCSRGSSLCNLKICKVVLSLQWWSLKSYLRLLDNVGYVSHGGLWTSPHLEMGFYLFNAFARTNAGSSDDDFLIELRNRQRRVMKCKDSKQTHNRSNTSFYYL